MSFWRPTPLNNSSRGSQSVLRLAKHGTLERVGRARVCLNAGGCVQLYCSDRLGVLKRRKVKLVEDIVEICANLQF